MISIVPFEIEHYQLIEIDEIHEGEDHSWIYNICDHKDFNALTAILDGQPIGIFGYYTPYSTCARAWAILSPTIKKYPIFLYSSTKNTIDTAIGTGLFKRVEMTIKANTPILKRWAHKLGFKLTSNLGSVELYVREV